MIILMALGLVVLIVLTVIFLSSGREFGATTKSCLTRAGKACQADPCEAGQAPLSGVDCPTAKPNCCIDVT